MLDLVQAENVLADGKFRRLIRARDIFFHDGKALRRIRLSVPTQTLFAVTALLLFGWSIFSAAHLASTVAAPAAATTTAITATVDEDVAVMERKLKTMEAELLTIKRLADDRLEMTEQEVRRLGLDPKRFTGTGGPFEAVEPLKAADPKFKELFQSWKKLDQIEKGTIAIPSTQPVKGTALTSGYGVRSDPFRGRAAMHAGIDLAGPLGTPIYATADGIVARAQWANGYGNLVEINHGRGIQTRYGHLSKSLVKPGQRVKRGDKIALMGSTGRSTGSHLHYEVRVDGKAVNPIPFMQSNDYLLAIQQRAAAATRVALGGPEGN